MTFGLNFSGEKTCRFKAKIVGNSPLFTRFVTQNSDIFALKNKFMTYSELP